MRNFEEPSFEDLFREKTAGLNLPSDSSQWRDKIYKRLFRMHPYLEGKVQGDIDWSVEPINEEEGNGVGLVTALVGKQPVRIPVVVRDFELKPVDLYVNSEGDLDVLNENIVMKNPVHQTVDVGQKVRRHSGIDQIHNGLDDRSLLSKVSSYQGFKEDCERMERHVVEDFPKLAESFKRIKKKAEVDQEPEWQTISVRHEKRPVRDDAFHVTTFHQGQKVASITATQQEIFDEPDSLGADLARKAKGRGGAVASRRELDKEALVIDQSGDGEMMSFSPGDGAVVPEEDGQTEGRIYESVPIEYPYQDNGAFDQVFIGDNSRYMYPLADPIRESSGTDPISDTKPINEVGVGDQGFLVIPRDEEQPAVCGPMKMLKWQQDEVGDESAVFDSRMGGRIYLVVSEVMPKIQKADRDEEASAQQRYIVPDDVEFFETDGEVMPEETDEQKIAQDSATYHMSGSGEKVEVRPPEQDNETLHPKEAQAMLSSVGATPQSAKQAVEKAAQSDRRVIEVRGLEHPIRASRGENRKVASNRDVVNNILDRWANAREPINKLAAGLPDKLRQAQQKMRQRGEGMQPQPMMPGKQDGPQRREREQDLRPGPGEDQRKGMQDSLNAINMLNQYNASKFSESLDEIEDAKYTVAEVLYRARTGEIDTVEESVVKDALFALDTVTEGLRELKATEKASNR